jgi:hypothetical protein
MPKTNKSKTKQKSDDEHEKKEESGFDCEHQDFSKKMPDTIPEEFYKIINDFTEDIRTTFPEYGPIINKWWLQKDYTATQYENLSDEELQAQILADKEAKSRMVFAHCLRVIPERFFDILYQNETMFQETSDINTEFLPGVVFKYLWTCDISTSTRETIWKYLQLMLFSIINSVKSSEDFGESAKLFEAINEDELKKKLEETLSHMQNMFDFGQSDGSNGSNGSDGSEEKDGSNDNTSNPFDGINMENMPSAESMHEHIQGMMKGNLGKLAMELAEEAAQDLNLDMDNNSNANDVFQKMFKNPGKLMNIVKNLGTKLDAKIKSGEIKESELISEGMEMLNKMKSMPGMNNMQEMLAKMGMPGMPGMNGKTKVNLNAMESQMKNNLKMAQMKERMKKKAETKSDTSFQQFQQFQQFQKAQAQAQAQSQALTDEQLFAVFSKGEKAEKSMRKEKPVVTSTTSSTPTSESASNETSNTTQVTQENKQKPSKKKK